MESTEAGWQSTRDSATRAAEVTWAIMKPELRPEFCARKGGSPLRARVHQLLHPALADRRRAGCSAMASTSSASETGCPWKLPPETMRSSVRRRPAGCRWPRSPRPGEHAPREGEAVARRAVHLGHAAERVGVLDLGAVGVALDDLAVAAGARGGARPPRFWPGCGRTAWMAAMNGRWLPSSPSRVIAPARSASSASASARSRASAPTAHIAWVPLTRARPSLASSTTGSRPGARQRGAPGQPLAAEEGLALADEDQREVGQRGEISRGADAASLGDDRDDAAVEHVQRELRGSAAGCPSSPSRARCSAGAGARGPRASGAASRRRRRGRG